MHWIRACETGGSSSDDRDDRDDTEMDLVLDGTPMMSANCWRAIEEAVLNRPRCRYLEWGSGNSTIAMLRLALETPSLHGSRLCSVEHDPEFASILLSLFAQTFSDAAAEVVISIRPIPKSKPSVVEALRRDPASLVTKPASSRLCGTPATTDSGLLRLSQKLPTINV